MNKPPLTSNWTDIRMDTGLSVTSLWTALTQLQEALNETLGDIGKKLRAWRGNNCLQLHKLQIMSLLRNKTGPTVIGKQSNSVGN